MRICKYRILVQILLLFTITKSVEITNFPQKIFIVSEATSPENVFIGLLIRK